MSWKEHLNKALDTIKEVAESEKVKNFTATAKQTATQLAQRAKDGALDAAQAFVEANSDPAALKVRFLNADLSVVSPSDDIEVTRPNAATLVIADGAGNGLVINAAPDKALVVETIGVVMRLDEQTFDLGPEDGINVIVLKS